MNYWGWEGGGGKGYVEPLSNYWGGVVLPPPPPPPPLPTPVLLCFLFTDYEIQTSAALNYDDATSHTLVIECAEDDATPATVTGTFTVSLTDKVGYIINLIMMGLTGQSCHLVESITSFRGFY